MEIIQQIKKLISEGSMKEALRLLSTIPQYQLKGIELLKRFNNNESTHSSGRISYADYTTIANQILKDFIDTLRVEDTPYFSPFDFKLAQQLTADELMNIRAQKRHGFNPDFYLKRPALDTPFLQALQQQKHVVIFGKPLAGKTRCVYETLVHHFPDANIAIAKRDNAVLPILPSKFDTQQIFIIFDDIDTFIIDNEWVSFIVKLLQLPNATLIATCRINYKENFEHYLSEWITYIEQIEVQSISDVDKQQLLRFAPLKKGDDTIGSYFLPTEAMQKVYAELKKSAEKGNLMDLVAIEILRTYKLSFWKENKRGYQDWIKEYVLLRLQNHYGNKGLLTPYQWEHIFQNLQQKGLIKIENEKITIEEIYLEKFVDKEGTIKRYIDDILNYPHEQDIFSINKLIRNIGIEDIIYVLNKIKRLNIHPDVVTLNTWLNKVSSPAECEQVFDRMAQYQVLPDVVTFAIWLNKVSSPAECEQVFDRMAQYEVLPDVVTFAIWLNKVSSPAECEQVFDRMAQYQVLPDVFTLNTWLNKVSSPAECEQVFDRMAQYEVLPDVFTLNTWLNKVSSPAECEQVFDRMAQYKVLPDVVTLNTWLNKVSSHAECEQVFDRMAQYEVLPNVVTLNTWLNKVSSHAECEQVFDRMAQYKVLPNVVTLNTWLNKVSSHAECEQVFDRMEQCNIAPDVVTFTTWLNKVSSHAECEQVFDRMAQYQVLPNVVTLNIWLNKVSSHAECEQVFDRMEQYKVLPDVVTFATWLNKVSSPAECEQVFNRMEQCNIAPDVVTFTTWLNKVSSHAECEQVFDRMEQYNIAPNIVTFTTWLNKVSSHAECEQVFDRMAQYKVLPNVVTLNTWLNKVSSHAECEQVFDRMEQYNIAPNIVTFNTLKKIVNNFKMCKFYIMLKIKYDFDCKVNDFDNWFFYVKTFEQLEIIESVLCKIDNICLDYPHLSKITKILYERFKNIEAILLYIQGKQYSRSIIFFNALLSHQKKFSEVQNTLAYIRSVGIEPNLNTFHQCLQVCISGQEIEMILEAITKSGFIPNEKTNSIIRDIQKRKKIVWS